MKKKIFLFNIAISFLLIGCTIKEVPTFDIKNEYAQNLQYTKIKKISKNNKILAIISITYLNSVDSKRWNDGFQNILISVYKNNSLDNQDILKVTMNNNKLTSYKKLEKEDELYEDIAIKNRWSEYYILSYIDTKEDLLSFKYNYNKSLYTYIDFNRF